MTYVSRIPVNSEYAQRLGVAFYNFTYLEWAVIWTIVKLTSNGFDAIPRPATAAVLRKALANAIDTTSPPLPEELRKHLKEFEELFRLALRVRNQLLHAHPYTAADGEQRLGTGEVRWSLEEVDAAALRFEEAAIFGNGIFHGDLAVVRP